MVAAQRPIAGTPRCELPHTGVVLSGHGVVAFADGQVMQLTAGKAFYVPTTPHDSWVVGDQPHVSLHVLSV